MQYAKKTHLHALQLVYASTSRVLPLYLKQKKTSEVRVFQLKIQNSSLQWLLHFRQQWLLIKLHALYHELLPDDPAIATQGQGQ